MPTRRLLQLAAFGSASALVVLLLTPFNTSLALLNPLVYAVTASLTLLLPFTARIWSGSPGAATGCAVLAGLLVAPVSALGFLLPLALAAPALCFDLVLWNRTTPRRARLLAAAATAGAAIWALSLPVIDPALLSGWFIAVLAALRLLSFAAMLLLARHLAAHLVRVGVHPQPVRRTPAS